MCCEMTLGVFREMPSVGRPVWTLQLLPLLPPQCNSRCVHSTSLPQVWQDIYQCFCTHACLMHAYMRTAYASWYVFCTPTQRTQNVELPRQQTDLLCMCATSGGFGAGFEGVGRAASQTIAWLCQAVQQHQLRSRGVRV